MIKTLLKDLKVKFPDRRERGGAFEKVCKFYLKNDRYRSGVFTDVWLWSEWPDRLGPDLGVDMVAKDKNGELWAIQCKNHTSTVPSEEIDKFIARAAAPQFSKLMLISTSGITKNSSFKLEQNEKPCQIILQPDLDNSSINWNSYFDTRQPVKSDPHQPRAYQRKAIELIQDGFKNADRGQCVMACGTGKTLVGLWVSELLESQTTLVLEPSLALLNQVSNEWIRNSEKPFDDILFVCSDPTMTSEAQKTDDYLLSISELPVDTTDDVEQIRTFLTRPGKKVVFCTYQSSDKIKEAQSGLAPFHLVVADEAHHCTGKRKSHFANVLSDENIKSEKRLFMTATPRYYTHKDVGGEQIGRMDELQAASMDDESLFGKVFFQLGFGEAIDAEILSPYRIEIVAITDDQIRKLVTADQTISLIDGNGPGESDKALTKIKNAESLASAIGLLRVINKHSLKKVISFHSRISRAASFSRQLDESTLPLKNLLTDGDGWFSSINGTMTTSERNRILEQFKEPRTTACVLSNAKCLGEGVDITDIDGIIFADPKKSKLEIIQAVGRAIRKSSEDKVATIIVPVFVDEESLADPEEAVLKNPRFKMLAEILLAIRAHDFEMGETLDYLRMSQSQQLCDITEIDRFGSDFPLEIDLTYEGDPEYTTKQFMDALISKSIELCTNSWWGYMGLLDKYCETHPLSEIDQYTTYANSDLGKWLLSQQHRKYLLNAKQVDALEQIPQWEWIHNTQKSVSKNDVLTFIDSRLPYLKNKIVQMSMSKLLSVIHEGNDRQRLYDYWYTYRDSALTKLNVDDGFLILGFKNSPDFLAIPVGFLRKMGHQDGRNWKDILRERRLDLFVVKAFDSYKFKVHYNRTKGYQQYIDITQFRHTVGEFELSRPDNAN